MGKDFGVTDFGYVSGPLGYYTRDFRISGGFRYGQDLEPGGVGRVLGFWEVLLFWCPC